MPIQASVGIQGGNAPSDVQYVQSLLNIIREDAGKDYLELDGLAGQKTIGSIQEFQATIMGIGDGRVDPGGKTLTQLELLIGQFRDDMMATLSLSCIASYEPDEVEPQPEEEPGLEDFELVNVTALIGAEG